MKKHPFFYTLRQLKPLTRRRGKVIRSFTEKLGLAYLGTMHQHDDEYDAIRGFTASTSHRDAHYAVGTYEGVNLRITDRFDIQKRHGNKETPQSWLIMEFELAVEDLPHAFFVPTRQEGDAYQRIFSANIHMQPLNSILQKSNHSPEFYGRYQILSRATHANRVESILTSPVIFGVGEKIWPCGIEVEQNKLFIYISSESLTADQLGVACVAGLWLTEELNKA